MEQMKAPVRGKKYIYTDGKKVECQNGLFIRKPFEEQCVLYTAQEVKEFTHPCLNDTWYFTAAKYSLLRH
jgi:hypothetical protein